MIEIVRLKRYHWLANTINREQYTIGVEVGAATGVTTKYLLENCPLLKQLIIVDNWTPILNSGQWERDDMEKIFRHKFRHVSKLRILKGLSWEMADEVKDGTLDFVFIDASHVYPHPKQDIKAWVPKLKQSGLLCGHDLHSPGVQQAVTELVPHHVFAEIDSTWYTYKPFIVDVEEN